MSFLISSDGDEIFIYRVEYFCVNKHKGLPIVEPRIDINNVDVFNNDKNKCWNREYVDENKFKLSYTYNDETRQITFTSNNLYVEQDGELHIIDSDSVIHKIMNHKNDFSNKTLKFANELFQNSSNQHRFKLINTFEELKDFVCRFYGRRC